MPSNRVFDEDVFTFFRYRYFTVIGGVTLCLSAGSDSWFFSDGLVLIVLVFVLSNFGSSFWIGALIEGLKCYQFRVVTNCLHRNLEGHIDGAGIISVTIIGSTRSFRIKDVTGTGDTNSVAVTVYQFTFNNVVLSALKVLERHLVNQGNFFSGFLTGSIDYLSSITAFQSGADARLRSHRAGSFEVEIVASVTAYVYLVFLQHHLTLQLGTSVKDVGADNFDFSAERSLHVTCQGLAAT